MKLPNDIKQRADSFLGLARSVKAKILGDLTAAPDDGKNKVIADMLAHGGNVSRFVKHVLDKSDLPGPDDSPENKRISPPQTL